MTNLFRLLSALAALTVPLTAAYAATRTYDVDANSRESFSLRLCSSRVDITAEGDGDTDLDFWIYGPSGRLIHADVDGTDWTEKMVYRSAAGCGDYRLVVSNLGDVYNRMRLSVRDV